MKRVFFLIILLLISITVVYAEETQNEYDSEEEIDYSDPWDSLDQEGFSWDDITPDGWAVIPSTKIGEVPAEHVANIPDAQLNENWDSADKSQLSTTKIINTLSGRPNALDLSDIDPTKVEEAIGTVSGLPFDVKSSAVTFDGDVLVDSAGNSYNLNELTSNMRQTILIDSQGVVQFGNKEPDSGNTDNTNKPDETKTDSAADINPDLVQALDLSVVDVKDPSNPFKMDLTQPTIVIAGDGTRVLVEGKIEYDGANVVVKEGDSAEIFMPDADKTKGDFKEGSPSVIINAKTSDVTISPKDEKGSFVQFKDEGNEIYLQGDGFEASYEDSKNGQILISLPQKSESKVSIYDSSRVTVHENAKDITVGSWTIDSDGKAKLPVGFGSKEFDFKMPTRLSISSQTGRFYDQQYDSADKTFFTAKLGRGSNLNIEFDGTSTVGEVVKSFAGKQYDVNGEKQPSDKQMLAFISTITNIKDLENHAGANFAQFPPDAGARLDTVDKDGNHFVTYTNLDGEILSIEVKNTDGNPAMSKEEWELAIKDSLDLGENDFKNGPPLNLKFNSLDSDNIKQLAALAKTNKNWQTVDDMINDEAYMSELSRLTGIPSAIIAGVMRTEANSNLAAWHDGRNTGIFAKHDSSTNDRLWQELGYSSYSQFEAAAKDNPSLSATSYAVYFQHLMRTDRTDGDAAYNTRSKYFNQLNEQYESAPADQKEFYLQKIGLALAQSLRDDDVSGSSLRTSSSLILKANNQEQLRTAATYAFNEGSNNPLGRGANGRVNNFYSGFGVWETGISSGNSQIAQLSEQYGVNLDQSWGNSNSLPTLAQSAPVIDQYAQAGSSGAKIPVTASTAVSLKQLQNNYNYWHQLANGNLKNTPGSFENARNAYVAAGGSAIEFNEMINLRDAVRDGRLAEQSLGQELVKIGVAQLQGQDGQTRIAANTNPKQSPAPTVGSKVVPGEHASINSIQKTAHTGFAVKNGVRVQNGVTISQQTLNEISSQGSSLNQCALFARSVSIGCAFDEGLGHAWQQADVLLTNGGYSIREVSNLQEGDFLYMGSPNSNYYNRDDAIGPYGSKTTHVARVISNNNGNPIIAHQVSSKTVETVSNLLGRSSYTLTQAVRPRQLQTNQQLLASND